MVWKGNVKLNINEKVNGISIKLKLPSRKVEEKETPKVKHMIVEIDKVLFFIYFKKKGNQSKWFWRIGQWKSISPCN